MPKNFALNTQRRVPHVYQALALSFFLSFIMVTGVFAQQPVIASHPRIFLDAATKTALQTKKNNNDADWQSVLVAANKYLPGQVIPWNPTTAAAYQYDGTADIGYNYSGSSWEEAAVTLGLAHQFTKASNAGANPTVYSDKLLALADVIIQGYSDYPPVSTSQPNMFLYNGAYATRHVGKAIGIIYDYCYDELGPTRKAGLLHVMKDWFTFMSATPQGFDQLQDQPTGNFFMGHVICAAYMGYAIGSDDPLSQKMIDFARQRITGDVGSLNPNTQTSAESARHYFTESVKGNLPSAASQAYLQPATLTAAPQKDGIPVQGWTYGGTTSTFLADYIYTVKSATGEDLLQTDASLKQFFNKTAEAIVHAYTPSGFQYDNANDNNSYLGPVTSYALPLRLTVLLEGSTEGANAEYFYKNQLKPVNLLSGNAGYPLLSWEKFLYNKTRAAAPNAYKPYYPIPATNTYNTPPFNTGLNKFYMRSNWGTSATWAAIELGSNVYDERNHNKAGHFKIMRGDSHDGDDYLLVAGNEVPQSGGNGIEGSSNNTFTSNSTNTLFINDYNDYDPAYPNYPNSVGGQTGLGYDEPTHQEQNDNFSYFRSDLTSAYYIAYTAPDTSERTVRYFYRSFLYRRNADIFLVYDKFKIKNSTNAAGQYKKNLRWHFLNQPVISGNNITETMDNSKLFIHTVLPAAVNIAAVNENNNPDNTFGPDLNYAFNTNTWRAEVNTTGDPLKQDIVTVMQPGANTAAEMTTAAVTTNENNMEGSMIAVNGSTQVVLFNSDVAKYPTPIATTTYAYTGPITALHSLCGMEPNKVYKITYTANLVTVTKSTSGTFTASPSGVLTFQLPVPTVASNVNLSSLALNPLAIYTKTTGSAKVNYSTSVTAETNSVTLTPVAEDPLAVIKVNGNIVLSGSASAPITLNAGPTTINILVTGQDAITTKTYSVIVNRDGSSNVKVKTFILDPASALTLANTGSAATNYTTSVTAGTNNITVMPVLADPGATVTVNGTLVNAGDASAPVTLGAGTTIINIVVTAEDGVTTRTYSIAVNKNGSSDVGLSNLQISPLSTLSKTKVAGINTYTTSVTTGTGSVMVTPTATDANATITVAGLPVNSGSASPPITLNGLGSTTINLVITAQDGVTTKNYTLIVSKSGSSIVKLKSIQLTPASVLTPSTGHANTNYTTIADAGTFSVTVTPVAADPDEVISVEGAIVNSGNSSAPITLGPGITNINMLVTAGDGITTRTYAIAVSKSASGVINKGFSISQTGFAKKAGAVTSTDGITVHQGLSPNGDGQNDYLVIDGIADRADNHLSIMNAGGVLVYDVKGYGSQGNLFDGHSSKSGKLQKPGTYYYSLEYNDGKTIKRKTGFIILKY
jgi:hypothetical protein